MSLGYASRLSYREDLGGQLGARELFDSPEKLREGVDRLSKWIQEASRVIVFTGAGISTACGIPDFRGPKGIWTLQRAGKPLPSLKTSFEMARPSLTHQALSGLVLCGKVVHIVSQNVDGLHLRSGIPRDKLAELHGNCFAERCPKCGKEYIRDFEMQTVGFQCTGRTCTVSGCRGRLRDHILDWDDPLPDNELAQSEKIAAQADLALCLGTSLQIIPARDIPLETVKAGGRLAIVNLQKTPRDKNADLVIHAKSDEVMKLLMAELDQEIPPYIRKDRFLVSHWQTQPRVSAKGKQKAALTLSVTSSHGAKCPMPMLRELHVDIPPGLGHSPQVLRGPQFKCKIPCAPGQHRLRLTLVFGDNADADRRETQVDYEATVLSADEYRAAAAQTQNRSNAGEEKPPVGSSMDLSCITQEVHFDESDTDSKSSTKRRKLNDVTSQQQHGSS